VGTAAAGTVEAPASRSRAVAPLVVGLVAVAALGLVAWPLDQLLQTAASIGGAR
jgi:hydrogenase-4 component F